MKSIYSILHRCVFVKKKRRKTVESAKDKQIDAVKC